jgi:hypothetical protein
MAEVEASHNFAQAEEEVRFSRGRFEVAYISLRVASHSFPY